MSKTAKVMVKKPEIKNKHLAPQKQKPDPAQFTDPAIERVLFLQRTIGNHAVQRMMKSGVLQAKLNIGQPGDKYEREADRIAEQVIRLSEPQVQHQKEEEKEEELQLQPLADQITPLVQRQIEAEEEEEEENLMFQRQLEEEEDLQTKAISGKIPAVTPTLESRIQALKGGGQLLPESTRAFFEPRFRQDFSQVRVHNDTQAAETAWTLNVKAFTVGRDIGFGAGKYSTETSSGKKLLAHELTHVMQQNDVHRNTIRTKPGKPKKTYVGEISSSGKQITLEITNMKTGKTILHTIQISEARTWLVTHYNWNGIIRIMKRLFEEFGSTYTQPTNLQGTSADDALIVPDKAIEYIVRLQAANYDPGTFQTVRKIKRSIDGKLKPDMAKSLFEVEKHTTIMEESSTEKLEQGGKPIPAINFEKPNYDTLRKIVLASNGLWSDSPNIVNIVGVRNVRDPMAKTKWNDVIIICWINSSSKEKDKQAKPFVSTTEPGSRVKSRQLMPQTVSVIRGYHHGRQPALRTEHVIAKERGKSPKRSFVSLSSFNIHPGGTTGAILGMVKKGLGLSLVKEGKKGHEKDVEFEVHSKLTEIFYLLTKDRKIFNPKKLAYRNLILLSTMKESEDISSDQIKKAEQDKARIDTLLKDLEKPISIIKQKFINERKDVNKKIDKEAAEIAESLETSIAPEDFITYNLDIEIEREIDKLIQLKNAELSQKYDDLKAISEGLYTKEKEREKANEKYQRLIQLKSSEFDKSIELEKMKFDRLIGHQKLIFYKLKLTYENALGGDRTKLKELRKARVRLKKEEKATLQKLRRSKRIAIQRLKALEKKEITVLKNLWQKEEKSLKAAQGKEIKKLSKSERKESNRLIRSIASNRRELDKLNKLKKSKEFVDFKRLKGMKKFADLGKLMTLKNLKEYEKSVSERIRKLNPHHLNSYIKRIRTQPKAESEILAKSETLPGGIREVREQVKSWSEGCQVIFGPGKFYEFLWDLDKAAQKTGQKRWYYTLIDARTITVEAKETDSIEEK